MMFNDIHKQIKMIFFFLKSNFSSIGSIHSCRTSFQFGQQSQKLQWYWQSWNHIFSYFEMGKSTRWLVLIKTGWYSLCIFDYRTSASTVKAHTLDYQSIQAHWPANSHSMFGLQFATVRDIIICIYSHRCSNTSTRIQLLVGETVARNFYFNIKSFGDAFLFSFFFFQVFNYHWIYDFFSF